MKSKENEPKLCKVQMTRQLQNSNEKLLRKKDVAEKLSCSTRTVDREASDGRLTKVKVRGGVRFRESEVQAIINSGVL
jgi:excisionase family DNA binding protein